MRAMMAVIARARVRAVMTRVRARCRFDPLSL